jgi:hypothetical protein
MQKVMQKENATILHGDCLEVLKTLPDNSVDAIVANPHKTMKAFTDKNVAQFWKEFIQATPSEFVRSIYSECSPVIIDSYDGPTAFILNAPREPHLCFHYLGELAEQERLYSAVRNYFGINIDTIERVPSLYCLRQKQQLKGEELAAFLERERFYSIFSALRAVDLRNLLPIPKDEAQKEKAADAAIAQTNLF